MSHQKGYSKWGPRYAREAEQERKKRRAAVRKSKTVKAHKRKVAGKVVHVKSYCRRPAKVARRVGTARQTGGDWGF